MASITLQNLVKQYGDGFPAVNDVSIDIADGEFIILVGPSGCGKSTLLRMIVGLEDITSGDLLIDGERVNEKAPRDRNLAMVFQNYALYPHLTVFENIAFPLRLAKGKHSDDEIRKVYRSLAMRFHPDRNQDPGAAARFQAIAKAYEVLSDPAKLRERLQPRPDLSHLLRSHDPNKITRRTESTGSTHLTKYY